MVDKRHNLKPDTVLKNYWNNNEQFADLFNAVLFDGRDVIKPEELEDADTEESSVLEHEDYAESIQAARDSVKISKRSSVCGMQFVILGMESQEHIHYGMPIRVMGYDYLCYKKQYDSNAKNYKTAKGLNEDEYLSRMKKTDKFIPVITIVVYYGEKPYDGATSLHGLLNIPEEMAEFINDYKMLLVEARENKLTLHNINNRDLFSLLQIILDRSIPKNEAKEKAIQYSRTHKPDRSVIMTVAGATNMKLDYNALAEKGDDSMCTLFEEIAKEGEIKGLAKGIIDTCLELGLSEEDILERLQKKLNIPLQTAQEYLEKFGNQAK